ncbi:Transferase [Corchorus olitorius]|uniref:Transferase n=1 Tax=Corchorus olitorius TaxID=93759 RepID=A0A1R3K5M9_9ROSI|nr:Transferase [Corchorus olitorius]
MEALGNNIPFTMERKSIVLVKPSTQTPSEVLSLSTLDNNPNLERIGTLTKDRFPKRIKDSKRLASTKDYMRKAMNIVEKRRQLNSQPDGATEAFMVLSDWRQLGVKGEMDFGWKSFVNMISLPWKIYGDVDLCLLMSPSKLDHSMKGGVKVLVSLPRASIAKFKAEMNVLNHGAHFIL